MLHWRNRPAPVPCRLPALAFVPVLWLAGCAGKLTGAEVPLLSTVSLSTRASAGAIRRTHCQAALPIRANLASGHNTLKRTRGEIGRALAAPTLPAGRRRSFGEASTSHGTPATRCCSTL